MSGLGSGPRPADEHGGWDELAVGWALHALEPEDETAFAEHLAGCPRCAQTVADTAEVMAAMAGDLPQAEPSDGLRERLRAAVEETEQLPPTPPRADRPVVPPATPPATPPAARPATPPAARPVLPPPDALPPLAPSRFGNLRAPLPTRAVDPRAAWRRVLPTALVAAAVAAVLSLGAWNVIVTGDRDAAQATAAQESRMLHDLLAPGRATIAPVAAGGDTVATVVARDAQVQVVSTALTPNDSHDQVYVLWGMVGGTVPQAIGTFDVVTPRMDLRTVGSSATGLDQYPAYAISLEPGRQAPSSPTDIVGQGQVTS